MKQAIICVDDEDIILEALKDQLGPFFENQYMIETSTTAEEALEIYDELIESNYEVPVVISDYLMPGMRGDEFLIKVHEKNPNTLKILLTGHANIEGITNAINKANLYRYIPKPWDRDDLILTVREAVRSFLQEIEIKKQNIELEAVNNNLEKLVVERTHELEKANATKDKFFSIIAHDLKNSFTGLLGYSDILLSDFDRFPDEEKKALVSAIREVSESTYKLLQNLLDWSSVQTGNIAYNPEELDLGGFLTDEFKLQQTLAVEKDLTITFHTKDDVRVKIDKNMISKVVRNIISNAIKYTKSGGHIEITLNNDDKFAYIIVIDSGIGIKKENINKLFKVNENYKTHGTNNEEGTGLGLILSKEFLNKNGGDISVESKVNCGTKVTFNLPLYKALK
ncbi:MAG: hybrid sensor histidine kinase/response regulator [Bacteroidales bacterium]|nr:hybrid sensor histidine kinase/response regulator [Bacteroidales bacterium]MDD3906977.1 hybrid sensor histidine kinase/response regulator [Bacteroidales bacterium]MDD4712261.1 hybrid sensor histidine kinase/response regulator [Bacteroidales bacterium]